MLADNGHGDFLNKRWRSRLDFFGIKWSTVEALPHLWWTLEGVGKYTVGFSGETNQWQLKDDNDDDNYVDECWQKKIEISDSSLKQPCSKNMASFLCAIAEIN